MKQEFFIQRPQINPTIYAYKLVNVPSHKGYIKVGFTDRYFETRVKEQLHTSTTLTKSVVGIPPFARKNTKRCSTTSRRQ